MTIEEMFGDLYSIDIMAEKKTGEIVLFLICYGFIDGEEKTQRALLTKIEAYLKYTKSAEFQNKYGSIIFFVGLTLPRYSFSKPSASLDRNLRQCLW